MTQGLVISLVFVSLVLGLLFMGSLGGMRWLGCMCHVSPLLLCYVHSPSSHWLLPPIFLNPPITTSPSPNIPSTILPFLHRSITPNPPFPSTIPPSPHQPYLQCRSCSVIPWPGGIRQFSLHSYMPVHGWQGAVLLAGVVQCRTVQMNACV